MVSIGGKGACQDLLLHAKVGLLHPLAFEFINSIFRGCERESKITEHYFVQCYCHIVIIMGKLCITCVAHMKMPETSRRVWPAYLGSDIMRYTMVENYFVCL